MQTGRLVLDQVVETSRFLNVSAVEYEGYVYLFGAGNPYRESPAWLARFRPRAIDRYKQWRFLGEPLGRPRPLGAARRQRQPSSSPTARPVRASSVRRDPTSGYFLMAYNCDDDGGVRPRGYYLRTAPRPWGPWSAPSSCSTPRRPTAATASPSISRRLAGRTQTTASPSPTTPSAAMFGGEYGPYLIPRFFRWEGGRLSVVYAHSSWNPYKAFMRTVLVPRGGTVGPPDRGAGLPRPTIRNGTFDDGIDGWRRLGTRSAS